MDLKIDITVSLSKETMAFLSGLMHNSCQCLNVSGTVPATEVVPVLTTTEEPAKPARTRRKSSDKTSTETTETTDTTGKPEPEEKPEEAPAPEVKEPEKDEKPADKPEPEYKIEDVRKAMAEKINTHRAELISKLRELGAKNVSTLDPAKYGEFIGYINSL